MSRQTTVGQLLINQTLPEDLRDYSRTLDKKNIRKLMADVAERYPDQYPEILQGLMDASRSIASAGDVSVSLRHLRSSESTSKITQKLREQNQKDIDDQQLTDDQRDKRIVSRTAKVYDQLVDDLTREQLKAGSPYALQAKSGSRGSVGQLASLVGADLLVLDHRGNPAPMPIYSSYSKGLDPVEYWAASYGTRKGLVDVKFATGDSGFLGKQLALAAQRQTVTSDRPPTRRLPVGLPSDIHDPDNEGAVLAVETAGYPPGTTLTPRVLEDVRRRHKGERILIHSPMTSYSEDGGLDQWSAGMRERGRLSDIGDNVGITAAQALSEPLSQGALDCLAEGTLVQMADWTTRPIESVVVGDYVLGANTKGQTFPVRVCRTYDHGVQEAWRTVFACRKRERVLESTLRHKVLVRTYFSNHSEETFNDVPRQLAIGKKNRDLKCVASVGFLDDSAGLQKEPLAYLIGALLGDGCYTASVGGVYFSCADALYVERFNAWLKTHNLVLRHLSAYYYRVRQLDIQTGKTDDSGQFVKGEVYNQAARVLKEHGLYGKYAHEKVLPGAVTTWDNASVAALIAGLFDTDGCLYGRKNGTGPVTLALRFSSSSEELAEGVRALLERRFGIYPAATVVRPPGEAGNFYAKHAQHGWSITDQESVGRFVDRIAPYLLGCKAEKAVRYHRPDASRCAHAGNYKRVRQELLGQRRVYDIEVEHPDHLFVLANGLIVSNSKHRAGAGKQRITREGFEYLNNLLQGPENFAEAGPLSPIGGTVTGVVEAPQGGHYVTVDDQRLYVRPGLNVTVKPGQPLEQGDEVSDGVPHPQDLVRYKGVGEARRLYLGHLMEGLRNSGVPIHRRNAESIVASVINHVQVTDPDGYNDHLIDQTVPFNTLAANYRARETARRVRTKQAVGGYLEEPVLHYTPGTRVTPSIAKQIQEFGVQDVDVNDSPPPFEPRFERLMTNTSHDPDWQTRLGGFYIGRSLRKSVHEGAMSDSKSTSFLPSLAQATTFGKDRERTGRY